MQAFISDLHGNLAALKAVMKHMRGLGVSKVFCLGDVVGYGPSPRECIQEVQKFELCLKGNHEAALLYYPDDFNPQARIALDWTRDQINSKEYTREENAALWNWIDGLPEAARGEEYLLVHGSPRDPVREYIVPSNIHDREKMGEIFEYLDRPFCFVGHSHVPGVYTENPSFIPPQELEDGFRPQGGKILVNVGSVGQPRDNDPRACYVTWDGEVIRFHRVEYNIDKTMNMILDTKVLPKILALRLKEGR